MIISKKYSPLAEDHATVGWSSLAEYLFNLGIILIFYISLSALYTVGAKQGIFVLPFLLAVLLWSRQTRPKNKSHP